MTAWGISSKKVFPIWSFKGNTQYIQQTLPISLGPLSSLGPLPSSNIREHDGSKKEKRTAKRKVHMRFLYSLSCFLVTVVGHIWYSKLQSKIKINQYCSQRKKTNYLFRSGFSKEGGRGEGAAALEKEEKSQQFGYDCILDPFRTRSANWFQSHVNAVTMCI